ncbi:MULTISPECIES: RICIN domain-containing protein [Aliivibrio]|uniref:RICIN domain-containing protein n=1 Tax=Aliivibrio TaxID=511678 RepID=UPI001020B61D|nr:MULTISPECIES: RICIN domain-containing protein [Aliivibrio]MDD9180381.1 hypothetical protein [Aliivibrio sp. A6]RYU54567.1 hypothetical protein ERW50_17360 [Aliivibrio finisterrensis]
MSLKLCVQLFVFLLFLSACNSENILLPEVTHPPEAINSTLEAKTESNSFNINEEVRINFHLKNVSESYLTAIDIKDVAIYRIIKDGTQSVDEDIVARSSSGQIFFKKAGVYHVDFMYKNKQVTKKIEVSDWQLSQKGGETEIRLMNSHKCLSLNDDFKNISVSECNGQPNQQWFIDFPSSGNHFNLKSVYAISEGKSNVCLGVTNTNYPPSVIACSGSGYSSMRLWSYNVIGTKTPKIRITQKYTGDTGNYGHFLGENNDGKVEMIESDLFETSHYYWETNIPYSTMKTLPVIGNKKALLISTYYSDIGPNLESMDLQIKQALANRESNAFSLSDAVYRSSHGELDIQFDVIDGIDIGMKPSLCTSKVVDNAKEAVKDQVNLSDYQLFFVSTQNVRCSWTGLASLPGNWSIGNGSSHKMWMWNHEFGHNLGGYHGLSLNGCTREASGIIIDDTCTEGTSGDPTNTLNGGGARLYPISYQVHAGWLDYDLRVPEIIKSGRYYLPYIWSENDIQGYRFLTLIQNKHIFLEYRKEINQYENWDESDPFLNGVIVRIAEMNGHTIKAYLVDTKPSTTSMNDAPLTLGEYFYHKELGLKVTLESMDEKGAVILVEFDDIK